MIELPYPPKGCWPNSASRMHWAAKGRDHTRAHLDAYMCMKGYLVALGGHPPVVTRLVYIVRPKTRRAPDRDNCVAAMKWYQDGICGALQVDDATLEAPKIIIGEPIKGGAVFVEVE